MRTGSSMGNECGVALQDKGHMALWARETPSCIPAPPHPAKAAREEGTALIIALFFTLSSAGMVFAGTTSLRNAEKKTDLSLRTQGQARQFADAGLIDSSDWYRRQTSQPVGSCSPLLDTMANPPILDTDDRSLGIVREFQIDRGAAGICTVWRLVSRAYISSRRNPALPYNQSPKRILSTATLETEIRRLTLVPPAQAAICVNTGSLISLSSGTRMTGGSNTGTAYRQGTGTATIGGGASITGTPSHATLMTWYDDTESVFGVDEDTLWSMPDYQITYANELPNPIPTHSIVFSDGDLFLSATNPLKGTGILYVKGHLYIPYGTASYFNGLIYATGDIYLYSPVSINGTVITKGRLYMAGSGDKFEVIYDDGILSTLMIGIGQYRFSSATYKHDVRGTLKIKKANQGEGDHESS